MILEPTYLTNAFNTSLSLLDHKELIKLASLFEYNAMCVLSGCLLALYTNYPS